MPKADGTQLPVVVRQPKEVREKKRGRERGIEKRGENKID